MVSPGGGRGPGRLRIGERLGLVSKAGEHGFRWVYYLKVAVLTAVIAILLFGK